jgi:predicted dehydrogenase
MPTGTTHSRRTFIGFGLAATAGYATRSARAQSPNEKLNVAIIGCGGRGRANMGGVAGSEHIYTLCDTNPGAIAAAKAKFTGAKTTSDWREIVSDPAVDAVTVSTADHHHALASIAAMRAGKHVYCEKPLAHTVQEARWMQDEYLERKDKIATQMGTQIHATGNYRKAVSLVRDGAVGQVKQAHVWCGRTINPVGDAVLPAQPVPEGFDWDVWLGPAAEREHSEGYWKGGNLNWNRRWEFGNGVLGDMGSHLIDLPYWALGLERPTSVKAEGTPADDIAAPPSQIVTWKHPARKDFFKTPTAPDQRDPLEVIWYHGPDGMKTMAERLQPLVGDKTNISKWHIGVAFVGENGTLVADYGKIVQNIQKPGLWRKATEVPPSIGHYKEWLKACRGEGESLCNFDYSGKLIEHNLLGNLAHRAALGKELEWDAEAFKITNDEGASALLSKEYREGWSPS